MMLSKCCRNSPVVVKNLSSKSFIQTRSATKLGNKCFIRKVENEGVSKKSEGEAAIDKTADQLTTMIYPILQNMGFSGVAGFSVAIALKVVGSALATLFGLAFITVQALAYFDIIEVNWGKIEAEGITLLDQNQDGKLDQEDLKLFIKNNIGVLSVGVPSVGGFLFGLLLGLR
eukprot:TRINITY_DN731_c0_g1_i1.p1 TRINITY_DN731_c0_g1~~TRINITY_DN731_c0_g1_i1.p1  ORF type:complete len:173 (-),score=22.21 TRINITY_DN731_c0_g1_i1:443-961(-)